MPTSPSTEAWESLLDVPGHDDLVGNMLVGVGEIDTALLVVAGDQGSQAQTIEHLHLLEAAGATPGICVAGGDALRVEPGGVPVRVREVQVRSVKVHQTQAGGRVALLLDGEETAVIRRGSVLTRRHRIRGSQAQLVRLEPSPRSATPRHQAEAQLHLRTDRVAVRVLAVGACATRPQSRHQAPSPRQSDTCRSKEAGVPWSARARRENCHLDTPDLGTHDQPGVVLVNQPPRGRCSSHGYPRPKLSVRSPPPLLSAHLAGHSPSPQAISAQRALLARAEQRTSRQNRSLTRAHAREGPSVTADAGS